MKRDAIVSIVGSVVLLAILLYTLDRGFVKLSDISSAIAAVLVFGIFGLLGWGFRDTIEKRIKGELRSETAFPVQVEALLASEAQPSQFEAEILRKEALHIGDTVFFRVRFSGKLVNGFLGTLVKGPAGFRDVALDDKTIGPKYDAYTKGNVHGFITNRQYEWSWLIPDNAPPGKYTFFIRAMNHFPLPWKTRLKVRIIHWAKIWISSIDCKVIDQPKTTVVHEKIETVIVNERRGFSA